jgi:hypothetical protein
VEGGRSSSSSSSSSSSRRVPLHQQLKPAVDFPHWCVRPHGVAAAVLAAGRPQEHARARRQCELVRAGRQSETQHVDVVVVRRDTQERQPRPLRRQSAPAVVRPPARQLRRRRGDGLAVVPHCIAQRGRRHEAEAAQHVWVLVGLER